jgi:hypothetical protein
MKYEDVVGFMGGNVARVEYQVDKNYLEIRLLTGMGWIRCNIVHKIEESLGRPSH